MSRIIGIDLGTTNSVVCIVEQGEPQIIINEEGGRLTPSVVGFSKDGDCYVGEIAKRQLLMYPENTVHSIKRYIGRHHSEAKEELRLLSYTMKEGADDQLVVHTGGREYSPQQLSAFILQKVKKSAEDFLGETVDKAVVTVPAYFTDRQRQATRDAGEIAGLDIVRIINEPTAAALAYTFRRKQAAKIVVYDFGGGTFDISILEVDTDVAEVLATAGNNHLGGNDIDARIVEWLLSEFKKSSGLDMSEDKTVRQRLTEAAEKAKMDLSSSMETEIQLPFLTAGPEGPVHLQTMLTRATFEFLVEDIVKKTVECCRTALQESGLATNEIDEVVLVGGSSRIPKVQELIGALFDKPLNKSFNPDEVVAIGAAIQGGILGGAVRDMTLLDVTTFSLGIETEGRRFSKLIPKGAKVPVVRSQLVSTVVNNQSSVKIHVLQGEENLAKDNVSLGEFELGGIQVGQRGAPRIEVSFTIDTDGIVNVSARDAATGSEQSIMIDSPSAMTRSEIDEAKQELDDVAESDGESREIDTIRHRVEKELYALESFLRDNKLKLNKREIFDSEQALKRGRMALVKRTETRNLEELHEYLVNYLGHLEQRAGQAGSGQDLSASTGDG